MMSINERNIKAKSTVVFHPQFVKISHSFPSQKKKSHFHGSASLMSWKSLSKEGRFWSGQAVQSVENRDMAA